MSFNTSFSRLDSEINRFSFAFSCSSSFSRRARSTFNPPYSCANGITSAPRFPLPCKLAATSSRSLHQLQPAAADSRSAPPYASSLFSFAVPRVPVSDLLNWYKERRALRFAEQCAIQKISNCLPSPPLANALWTSFCRLSAIGFSCGIRNS